MGKMTGRENQKESDRLHRRKDKNRRAEVVNALGRDTLAKIYGLADVYHSDNIDRVSDDFIAAAQLPNGSFDNIKAARYAIPTHWDIGKVYKRLILGIMREKNNGGHRRAALRLQFPCKR